MNVHKRQMIFRVVTTVLSIGVICFIFSRSMMPATESGTESGRVVEFLNSISRFFGMSDIFTDHFVRKCAHLTEFAVLGMMLFCMYSTYITKSIRRLVCTFISYATVAVCDECIQLFSEGRAAQVGDVCIDILGATLGTLFVFAVSSLIARHKRKRMNS